MGEAVGGRMSTLNPYATIAEGNYCRYDGRHLVRADDVDAPPTAMTAFVHDSIVSLVLNDQFTCTGAKSAIRQQSYRFGLYGELGSGEAAAALARDLYAFVSDAPAIPGDFTTMIASFESPAIADEAEFERLLWQTLQRLHDLDAAHDDWAPNVSRDPDDVKFSFSFAGTAFFIVGLHGGSSRATRRFAWPTLVFNLHDQFEALKASGHFARFRQVIRNGEERLQGDINPMSADFGERSEAAQYSGREVDAQWRCPFAAKSVRR